jgi:5-methyltetrahydrofolate--homocysteine methyltransferase
MQGDAFRALGGALVLTSFADTFSLLHALLKERALVIDGAMGTMVQAYKLSEEEFRGERFRDHAKLLKGNNDLLCITRPQVVQEM